MVPSARILRPSNKRGCGCVYFYKKLFTFKAQKFIILAPLCASVAELVDAIDSKSIVPWDVSVQVGSEVP
jgi:hypothetical protein